MELHTRSMLLLMWLYPSGLIFKRALVLRYRLHVRLKIRLLSEKLLFVVLVVNLGCHILITVECLTLLLA